MVDKLILNNWHKAYITSGCALSMWLASQAPVGKVGKGVLQRAMQRSIQAGSSHLIANSTTKRLAG